MEDYEDIMEQRKLLRYLNQFWVCFNKEDRKDILEILLRALNRTDAEINTANENK